MCIDTRECSFSTELSDLLTRHTRLGTRRRVRKISRRRQYVFSLNSTYPWVIETFARWRRNGTVTADGRSSGGSGSRKITIIEHVLDRRDIARSGRATSLSLSLSLPLSLEHPELAQLARGFVCILADPLMLFAFSAVRRSKYPQNGSPRCQNVDCRLRVAIYFEYIFI